MVSLSSLSPHREGGVSKDITSFARVADTQSATLRSPSRRSQSVRSRARTVEYVPNLLSFEESVRRRFITVTDSGRATFAQPTNAQERKTLAAILASEVTAHHAQRAETKGRSKTRRLNMQRASLDKQGRFLFDLDRHVEFWERRFKRLSPGSHDRVMVDEILARANRSRVVPNDTYALGFAMYDPIGIPPLGPSLWAPPPYLPDRAEQNVRRTHVRGYGDRSVRGGAPDGYTPPMTRPFDPSLEPRPYGKFSAPPPSPDGPTGSSLSASYVRSTKRFPPLSDAVLPSTRPMGAWASPIGDPHSTYEPQAQESDAVSRFLGSLEDTAIFARSLLAAARQALEIGDTRLLDWKSIVAATLALVKATLATWRGHVGPVVSGLLNVSWADIYRRFTEWFHTTSFPGYHSQAKGDPDGGGGVHRFLLALGAYGLFSVFGAPPGLESLDTFTKSFAAFRSSTHLNNNADFLSSIVAAFKWFATTSAESWRQGSLAPFAVTTYYKWYAEVDEALNEDVLIGIDSGAALSDHSARLARLVLEGKQHQAKAQGGAFVFISKQLARLTQVTVAEQLRTKVRDLHEEPFFVGFFGPPKVGKTHILNQVAQYAAHARGRPYYPERTFVWNLSDQFASGLTNHTETIIIDDVGTVDPGVSAQHALAPILEVMNLANDQPSATNQADLADKGKIFARPALVLVTSNDPQFGVRKALRNPAAYLRRIRYKVQLIVLPAFRAKDSSGEELYSIDPEKASAAPLGTPMHGFVVTEFCLVPEVGSSAVDVDAATVNVRGSVSVGVTRAKVVDRIVLGADGPVSAHVFWPWLKRAMEAHYSRVSNASARSKELARASLCKTCHMIGAGCVCAQSFEPQSFGDVCDWLVGTLSTHVFDRCRAAPRVLLAAGVQRVMQSFGPLRDWSAAKIAGHFSSHVVRRLLEILGVVAVTAYLHSGDTTFERRYDAVRPFGRPYEPQSWVVDARNADSTAEEDVYARGRARTSLLSRKGATVPVAVLADKLLRATGVVRYETSAGKMGRAHFVLMDVGQAILNHHTFNSCRPGTDPVFTIGTHTFTVPNDPQHYRFLGLDVVLVRVPPHVRTRSNLWDYVPTRPLPEGSAWPTVFQPSTGTVLTGLGTIERLTNERTPLGVLGGRYLRFSSPTEKGDCGRAYIAQVGASGSALLGIHFLGHTSSGGDRTGIAELLDTSQEFSLAVGRPPAVGYPRLPVDYSANGMGMQQDYKFVQGQFRKMHYPEHRPKHIGAFPPSFRPVGYLECPVSTPKTKYVPSPLYDAIPASTKVPPCLGVVRTPSYYNPFNAGIEAVIDCLEAPKEDVDWRPYASEVYDELAHALPDSKALPLTEEESLNGLDGVKFINGFDQTTSAGFPMCCPKSEYIRADVDGRKSYVKEYRSHVRAVARSLGKGINPCALGRWTLKDELKKPAKDPRVFTVQVAAVNDLMRRITLPVMRLMQLNPLETGISVGVNAQSYMWGQIYAKHVGRPKIAWDFKSFDKSHSKSVMSHALWVLFRLCQDVLPPGALVEGVPWETLLEGGLALVSNPAYLIQGVLYEVDGCFGSGWWVTTIGNSLIQKMYHQYAWNTLYELDSPRGGWRERLVSFRSDVYGDDGIGSSTDPRFNFQTLRLAMKRVGVTVTPADKSDAEGAPPFVDDGSNLVGPVDGWDYLKRPFIVSTPGVFDGLTVSSGNVVLGRALSDAETLAPLALQSVYKSLKYWVLPATSSPCDHMSEIIMSAAINLSDHYESSEANSFWSSVRDATSALYPEHPLIGASGELWLSLSAYYHRPQRYDIMRPSGGSASGHTWWRKLDAATPFDAFLLVRKRNYHSSD